MFQKSVTGSHIFIIEDDPCMQHILNYCFSRTYVTTVFNNGMAALSALQNGVVPDLIVTDLNTPLLNGLELVLQVKASPCFGSIPVIIVSADHSSDKKIKSLSAGADDYVLKPFTPKELVKRADIVLNKTSHVFPLLHA